MLSRELSPIDWGRGAGQIRNQVRGLIPWPCATTALEGKTVKIYRTETEEPTDATPGTILYAGKRGIRFACGGGSSLYITELQAEGGKRMAASAYLAGHPIKVTQ